MRQASYCLYHRAYLRLKHRAYRLCRLCGLGSSLYLIHSVEYAVACLTHLTYESGKLLPIPQSLSSPKPQSLTYESGKLLPILPIPQSLSSPKPQSLTYESGKLLPKLPIPQSLSSPKPQSLTYESGKLLPKLPIPQSLYLGLVARAFGWPMPGVFVCLYIYSGAPHIYIYIYIYICIYI